MDAADQNNGSDLAVAVALEQLLNQFGFKIRNTDEKRFEDEKLFEITSDKPRSRFFDTISIPVDESQRLIDQLSGPVRPLSDHFGFFTDDGYFELMVRMDRIRRSPFDPWLARRFANRKLEGCSDEHTISGFDAIDTAKYERRFRVTALKDVAGAREGSSNVAIHVCDQDTGACVELSRQSACGILFGIPNGGHGFRCGFSIKIRVASSVKTPNVVASAYTLANSFMYELAVRNLIFCEPISRAEYERDDPPRATQDYVNTVRFPVTKIGPEVAELYSFAEYAIGNPPLAFLSFYQVLEYFFPQAIRRAMIRDIKRELSDPRFSASDNDVMKIIGIADSGVRANESEQIATLLESAVREDRLYEFFELPGNKSHFSRGGPISGVDTINPDNRKDKIARQVSNRVYQLRNRIVHAKDDPKYANVKVLLPRSREAANLQPDIDLVKLLAQEVIVDSQV